MSRVAACLAAALLAWTVPAGAQDAPFEAANASLEILLFHAQREPTTDAKRTAKRLAREELFARKADALDFLLGEAHVENVSIRVLADELANQLTAAEALPVLLRRLEDARPEARALAAYFLGLFRTPEHAERLLALLDDPEARRLAIRTLGKWRVREAGARLDPFLAHEDERVRVMAANALRDIGDPRAAPALLAALDDPVFTVRKTAARALGCLGREADDRLLDALPRASVRARRELIGLLAARPSPKAVAALRECLADADPGVRLDAARALRPLDPRAALPGDR